MTYEEFRSDLLRKLEEKTNDLGYKEVKYYPDGFITIFLTFFIYLFNKVLKFK